MGNIPEECMELAKCSTPVQAILRALQCDILGEPFTIFEAKLVGDEIHCLLVDDRELIVTVHQK